MDCYNFFRRVSGVNYFISTLKIRNNFMPESIVLVLENINLKFDFTANTIKNKRAYAIKYDEKA